MPALTAQFIASLETQMQALAEVEYLGALRKVWWPLVMKRRPSRGRQAVLAWLLSTAQIHEAHGGGDVSFEDLAQLFTEIEPKFSNAGLRLTKAQLEDARADSEMTEGVDLALAWAEQISAAIAYWPQRNAALILRGGEDTFDAYDGSRFFATDHPLNPFRAALGTYSNLLTGASAAPIDVSVDLATARENLGKVYEHIGAIKLPHGDGFRCLRPKAILGAPKLFPRLQELTQISLAIPVTPETTLVEAAELVNTVGGVMPVNAGELSGFESETTYFVACEQVEASQLGAMVYLEREPHAIKYYGPEASAELDRARELQWIVRGRNRVAPGHPYLLFKVKAA